MIDANCLVIAHRGASSYAPENTLAAFDLALAMGVRHLELDVHAACDGPIVVIHDDRVDRTTHGTGAVADKTLAELRALDAGAWFGEKFAGERIPTFEEVLQRYKGRLHLHVEIKGHSAGLAQRTVDWIGRYAMKDQVAITSFQKIRLEEVRLCAPELPIGWLVAEASDEIVEQARALGCTQLCPRADTVTAERVRCLHAEGFEVRAWGVKDEALMRQVVQAGADGMTVNFPDKLMAYLSRL